MTVVSQLPLGVQLREPVSFATFWPGPNADAVAALHALASGPGAVFLYSAGGYGKTHLLQALARAATEAGRRAAYLDLHEFRGQPPTALEGLEQQDVVCLDSMHTAFLQSPWTLGVLRLTDELRARGKSIALAAKQPPERADSVLPDLATRLSAFTVFGLKPLLDPDRRAYLRERAAARGLEMSEDVAALIVSRMERSISELLAVVEQLDRAALAAQRKLTLPFVRSTLGLSGR
ncbi:MAG: DnaA regulatory inactivator Hda [Pseudomonadota bacterium]